MESSSLPYLDEEPVVNFERATLEIAKEAEPSDFHHTGKQEDVVANSTSTTKVPRAQDALNIPFKHVDVESFFSDRNEVVERALKDCYEVLIKESQEDVIGSWLLTEISIWDTEKERLVILSKQALYSVKYDFISLKILNHNRISLTDLDTVVSGELVYPPTSLVPRLNGLAEGVSSVIHCAIRQQWSSIARCPGFTQFEPRKRNMLGVRLMWNKGQPLPMDKKWNPFAKGIPWITFASHPLFWHKGSEGDKARFDVEGLHTAIISLLPDKCNIDTASIIIENYCGLGALVHNRNGLGFFKIRGKVSF